MTRHHAFIVGYKLRDNCTKDANYIAQQAQKRSKWCILKVLAVRLGLSLTGKSGRRELRYSNKAVVLFFREDME